ncbi:SKI2 subunit of superkiller complex protein isoform X1 [Diorhabda carinulata]|uniref:SKI2 subunit of superkiller complex protein isoform X1 n=1 Tax=Diorhabda carinulata TaxID=1163345 RepID=UPI0025A26DF0|nr:SKI2 subunit of superkiller complex protein isoform X1 [Diorhabda carinulata]XP_057669558.1 SKI2 subunit of superkiller complex protein isoform X1 [Diorhabda carinulata]
MVKVEVPPILPSIDNELKKYLLCPENLPIHQYEKNQKFWPRQPKPEKLLYFEGSPLTTTLQVRRDPNTGEILDFKEVSLQSAGATAKNSMSLNRAPVPPTDATFGGASYKPFWPGSFPPPELINREETLSESEKLLTIPPGFNRGLVFQKDGRTLCTEDEIIVEQEIQNSAPNVINLLEIVQREQDLLSAFESEYTIEEKNKKEEEYSPEEEEIIPKEVPILNISKADNKNLAKQGSEWAILLDTSKPVKNFKEKIPEMAIEYPFELDVFQKLAILQLEQHNHVFVAAHTSAGKTVVAEYAIALSQKHMTKTIYTSPIKALSNQKYRDFKDKFEDVGLITGDFQINPKASCLIMTTEILRSMLYCGSDITRDLEYAIFDEVHYINDRERGHVWEQVLIMLPAQVCVVLLSATVPNTLEFADWLGRTHQRKVYVVNTHQRPVPLKHYLYTGKGGSTRDNRFMILNADEWILNGYNTIDSSHLIYNSLIVNFSYSKAKESISNVQQKNPYQKPGQEKTLWSGLIAHLKKNDLLPVVAFTFSRLKCDNNAANLTSLDLTTQKEKAYITLSFNRWIRCLKEPDQNIPQIMKMRDILTRGIGVHHSGILPIIKEIVEMLFQQGYIKLLFATETFAMGVNMPARTVVFDTVRKHDGKEVRDLESAEYIQMAGRAGRRGLDAEGTVIILCKQGVPQEVNLKRMMLGKPNSLVSQFRLTYGMLLSLLRVESLSVEGMMSRSFREADHQKNMVEIKKKLVKVEGEMKDLCRQQISSYLHPLVKFYEIASFYLNVRKQIMNAVLSSPKVQKILNPGRLIVITQKNHINKLAMILSTVRSKLVSYKVLVLNEQSPDDSKPIQEDLWYYMLSLVEDKLYCTVSASGHEMLTVGPEDIFEISGKTIKVNTDLVMKDVEKRQMDRFKNDPVGQTCLEAVQELHKLTTMANNDTEKLEFLHYIIDLNVKSQELYYDLQKMYDLKDKLIDHLPSTKIPNFEEQFSTVFKRKFLEEQKKNLEYQLSNASLSLYPDYENRIQLLKRLNYVDGQNKIQLKGYVACEIGMNELLLTELILRNVLTKLKAAEVAALLSALVFRVKTPNEVFDDSGLTPDLKKAIVELRQVHLEIGNEEQNLRIQTDEFQEELNFGLVHVVYEWATNQPFADIMKLTDIQEGIIVRCIQQLNETIMDVRDAARIVGDPELKNKMEEASASIKRDIVFTASLYTLTDSL